MIALDGRSVKTGREPIAVEVLDRGKKVAVLTGRERTLEIYDARTLERVGKTGAGIGPTGLATDGVELLWVTDVKGDALLVFHLRPRFELIRRVHQIGGPYAIAFDRERRGLWITVARTNQLVHYAAGSRPVLRETFPSIRDARRGVRLRRHGQRVRRGRDSGPARAQQVERAGDGEQRAGQQQPARHVALELQPGDARVGSCALAADRAPEDEQASAARARRGCARS